MAAIALQTVWIKINGIRYQTYIDTDGVQRFPKNSVITTLLRTSTLDLNTLWGMVDDGVLDQRDMIDLYVAMGYSLSGMLELSVFADLQIENPIEVPDLDADELSEVLELNEEQSLKLFEAIEHSQKVFTRAEQKISDLLYRCVYCGSKGNDILPLYLVHAPGTNYQCYNPKTGDLCVKNIHNMLPDGSTASDAPDPEQFLRNLHEGSRKPKMEDFISVKQCKYELLKHGDVITKETEVYEKPGPDFLKPDYLISKFVRINRILKKFGYDSNIQNVIDKIHAATNINEVRVIFQKSKYYVPEAEEIDELDIFFWDFKRRQFCFG